MYYLIDGGLLSVLYGLSCDLVSGGPGDWLDEVVWVVLRNLFLLGPISFSSDSKDGEVDGVTEMLFANADEKVSVFFICIKPKGPNL